MSHKDNDLSCTAQLLAYCVFDCQILFFLRNTECGAEVDGDVVWHGKVWHGKVAWEGVAGEGVAGEGVAWEVVTQEGFHLWCFVFRGMG